MHQMHYSAQPRTTESRKTPAAVDGLRPAILAGVESNLAQREKRPARRAASDDCTLASAGLSLTGIGKTVSEDVSQDPPPNTRADSHDVPLMWTVTMEGE